MGLQLINNIWDFAGTWDMVHGQRAVICFSGDEILVGFVLNGVRRAGAG